MRTSACEHTASKHVEITGIVQGVGFRPFVRNLATLHGLRGWVRNTTAGVELEVSGPFPSLDRFLSELVSRKPPRAYIENIDVTDSPPCNGQGFAILKSLRKMDACQPISPDIATCEECLSEMLDPLDRRYLYPFINCTNCGPRFTIIKDLPYDRPNTTMRMFSQCRSCNTEYADPADRRYHAQPNACPACGPHIRLVHTLTEAVSLPEDPRQGNMDVIRAAGQVLGNGMIVAVKGLGGYHLACDGTNENAVRRLRKNKRRSHKPFAVMMSSLEQVQRHCRTSEEEEGLLNSPARPIVLLHRREDSTLSPEVAPNQGLVGVMLPYTPLHHLLLRETGCPLVMTSGNLATEPIVKDNEEALKRLDGLADAFLMHNREIHMRCDDSVWFVPLPGRPQPLRRARGYAPEPVRLPFSLGRVLACGAGWKNTFCLTRGHYAFVSQHVGDMESLETAEYFEATIQRFEHLFRTVPEAVACDMHPDYMATRYARERSEREGIPLFAVQHHHAHIAACLADNAWDPTAGPVLGVAMDGTGLGTDGCIWGGEFLIAGYDGFRRFGHLEYVPLPGGELAIRKPYRMAISCLYTLLGRIPDLPFLASVPRRELEILTRMISTGIQAPLTSSCGRLFDAVSALLGVCPRATYEGQAAVELEGASGDPSSDRDDRRGFPFSIEDCGGTKVVGLKGLFEAILEGLKSRRTIAEIGALFHFTLAAMILEMCEQMRKSTGISTVALSGGCFQNRRLLRLAVESLEAKRFQVLTHCRVPCNDGGLCLGQAVVTRFRERGDV